MSSREYGSGGLVGILTPQANVTVEAELSVLLEPDVATVVSRLTCYEADSRARLLGYFRNVGEALRAFDTARPELALFACTGSTYLVGLEEEQRVFRPLNIRSAAQAVLAALDALDARRLALVSPYPSWLTEACLAFWRGRGREVLSIVSPEGDRSDTRRIYALGSRDARQAITRLGDVPADAVLVTGTGMPSLGAIAITATGVPVLSSNLCLAWLATRQLAGAPLDRDSLVRWLVPEAAWRARLAARFPSLKRESA